MLTTFSAFGQKLEDNPDRPGTQRLGKPALLTSTTVQEDAINEAESAYHDGRADFCFVLSFEPVYGVTPVVSVGRRKPSSLYELAPDNVTISYITETAVREAVLRQ